MPTVPTRSAGGKPPRVPHEILKRFSNEQREVLHESADRYGVSVLSVLGTSKVPSIVEARRDFIVDLYGYFGLKQREVADLLGVRQSTVRLHLLTARVDIRRKWTNGSRRAA